MSEDDEIKVLFSDFVGVSPATLANYGAIEVPLTDSIAKL